MEATPATIGHDFICTIIIQMLEREREEPRGSEHRSNHEAPEHRSNERDRNDPR